jgi:predicted Zn-dependent peptidase
MLEKKSLLTTLPGGLRIATCEMPHAETAAMGIWASVGGRHEPPTLNGISHFIEHMLFKGTAKRSARRIMDEIEGIGGDLNAYTSEERTCYYATSAAEFFPRVCDVLCDIYTNPRFAKRDIDRERGVIAEEIQMYRDEPSSHIQELLQKTFWAGHPLGRPLTGTLETISGMDAEAFRAYRTTHYHARNTIVTAAGKIRHEEVVDRVAAQLDSLPTRKPRAVKACPAAPTAPRLAVEGRDIQQTQLALVLPSPGHCDARRYAFHLLNVILGANASSRLFQEMREKRGLCYSVSSHWMSLNDGGYLDISAGLDRKNIEKSLTLIFSQFDNLREKPVGAAELRRAKDYTIGSSLMALERAASQNSRLGGSILSQGEIVPPETVNERIRSVTAAEIQEVAREVLDPSRITLAIVGPNPDEPLLKKILGI